jgi:sugar (pentulose or hexulose) kinase
MLNIADWIAFRLSGEAATDFSLASRTACLDLGRRCWSAELLSTVDIDIRLLPPIRPSGTALGPIRPDVLKATGLPGRPLVGVGAHDHICGWFAAGEMDDGVLLDSMGTAEAILTAVRQPVTVQDIVRQGYAQGAIEQDEPRFYLGGTINSSGGAVEWFRRLFAGGLAHQWLIEEAAASPPGSNGVYFVPHFAGAGPPFADVPARGAVLGLTASTGRGDAFRAVLEGLALEARSVRDAMMVLPGVPVPRSVLVIGGHVHNRLLLEIKASVYRQALRVIAEPEATALEAALLGGIAAGLWPDLRTALMEVRREEFNIEPRPDWIDTYEVTFTRSYFRLTPLLRPVNETLQYVPATG